MRCSRSAQVPETRGLVTRTNLDAMKPGALEAALRARRPGYAAVDIFEQEAEPLLGGGRPLLALPDALCTPHIRYVECDNYKRYFGMAFDNIVAFSGKAAELGQSRGAGSAATCAASAARSDRRRHPPKKKAPAGAFDTDSR